MYVHSLYKYWWPHLSELWRSVAAVPDGMCQLLRLVVGSPVILVGCRHWWLWMVEWGGLVRMQVLYTNPPDRSKVQCIFSVVFDHILNWYLQKIVFVCLCMYVCVCIFVFKFLLTYYCALFIIVFPPLLRWGKNSWRMLGRKPCVYTSFLRFFEWTCKKVKEKCGV